VSFATFDERPIAGLQRQRLLDAATHASLVPLGDLALRAGVEGVC
jgi:hypothetical protein